MAINQVPSGKTQIISAVVTSKETRSSYNSSGRLKFTMKYELDLNIWIIWIRAF